MMSALATEAGSSQSEAVRARAPQGFHIPSLDGMRTVAIAIVFIAHAGLEWIPGGFGVTIFFFLSGYLIATLLRREYESSGHINLGHFYVRRIFRIWPAFYLVLLVGTGLTLARFIPGRIEAQAFLAQVLHFTNYYSIYYSGEGITTGSSVYWSLAVEEHFYLLFPLFYMLLLRLGVRPRSQALIFLGICLLVLLWRCYLVYALGAPSIRTYYASDTRIDSILFGCILAVYGNPAYAQDGRNDALLKKALLPAGLALLVFSFLFRSPEFRETFRYSLQGIALYPIFMTVVRFPRFGVARALNWGWMQFLGTLSYSFYLVHHTVLHTVDYALPGVNAVALALIAAAVSIGLAYAIYRLVERPSARLRRRLLREGREQTA
jgi:peptidoglycan/LPS O-acetylase OafA/YrhL